MTLRERTKGMFAALLGAAGAFALAVPGAVAVASTVTTPGNSTPTDGTKLVSIEQVPFRTIVIEDDSLPVDVEVEDQAGIPGEKHVFATAIYVDGEIPKVREQVVTKPQDRIILRGTKLEMPKAEPAPEPEPEPEPEQAVATRGAQSVEQAGEAVAVAPPTQAATAGLYSLSDLQFMGVVNWNGYKFTYYSQSALPGGGLAIPGRHVSAAGYVSDGSGYIVLAAAPGIPHGSVFSTPFGASGKVYDTCASCTPNWLDVYTR